MRDMLCVVCYLLLVYGLLVVVWCLMCVVCCVVFFVFGGLIAWSLFRDSCAVRGLPYVVFTCWYV